MKKQIKIKFLGFWTGFDEQDNFILNALKKYYDVVFAEKPDYLFYSCFTRYGFDYLNYDCVRIFFSGENVSPDFNFCDYSIGFDEITYNDRHLCFPLFLGYPQLNDCAHKHEGVTENTFFEKEYFCNFIFGHGRGMKERENFFHKLSEYKTVSSCGTYLTNTEPVTRTQKDKLAFQKKCRFTIAFESVAQPGFVTEKILHAFAAQTVPIYCGNKDITHIFDPNSFINCHDFDDWDQVVARVKEIEECPSLWAAMVKTPCFTDPNYPTKKMEELDAFLRNIMDQPLEKAFRRPLMFMPVIWQNDIKKAVNIRKKIRANVFAKVFSRLLPK